MATPRTPLFLANPISSNPPLSTFNYKITEKLTNSNYLICLQQIEPVLRAHRLHWFCVSPEIPPQFINEEDRAINNENPAFSAWELQDQLLLLWLQSSLSPSILPQVLGCRHTFQLWERIHTNFQSKTKATAHQLRAEFRTTKKNKLTIAEFFAKIEMIVNSLMSIGETVTTIDQMDVILAGLPPKFQSIQTLISSKRDWFEYDEAKALILAHEQRIAQEQIQDDVATLNVTQTKKDDDSKSVNQLVPQANYTNRDATQNLGQNFRARW